ncbi:MAG: UvrD-helicase domain-containing protein [Rhodothermia bacterium]|nr:MAG: UvrD-helicase domain-containing protein [Rhodothermia bacterium]
MILTDDRTRATIRGDRDYSIPLSGDDEFSLDENFIVKAGAGSGKTSLLIERMVALVRCGIPMQQIAAITFTRKAAGEMRGRFFKALNHARLKLSEAVDRASAKGSSVTSDAYSLELQYVEAARGSDERPFIDTIHTLCSTLLREHSFSFGLAPDFTVVDERQERILRRQFWNQYLRQTLTPESSWREDFARLGISPSDLFDYFGERASFAHFVHCHDSVAEPDLVGAIESTEEYFDWISERMPFSEPVDRISGLIFDFARYQRIRGTSKNADRAAFLENLDSLVRRDGSLLSGVVAVTKWSPTKTDPGRVTADALKGSSAPDGEDRSLATFVTSIVRPALTAWKQFLHAEIEAFVVPAVEDYSKYRREQGRLKFDDLLMFSVDGMRQNSVLRESIQNRFTHLLVDEFQDTDPLQSHLILLMTSRNSQETQWKSCQPRAGSLFMVGDEKQSIYRFRHADLRVFRQVAEQITASGGRTLYLQSNFRSRPEICAWINSAVKPLFDQDDRLYQADFESLSAATDPQLDTHAVLQSKIDRVFRHDATEVAREDAKRIAHLIRSAVDGPASATVEFPTARFSDFLILCRVSKRMHIYSSALEESGIPYVMAGGKALSRSIALSPLIDLMDTVYNPDDPIARLAYLRGPFSGLADDTLYRFVQAKGEYIGFGTLPDSISKEDRATFGDAFDTLVLARQLFEECAPSHALEQLISRRGLMAAFAFDKDSSAQTGAIQRILSLVRSWESAGFGWSEIRAELHRLQDGEIEEEGMTLETGTTDTVRLFNVHQAKGLQSRIVCLADPLPRENHSEPRLHIDRSAPGDKLFLTVRKGAGYYARTIAEPPGWETALAEELKFENAERTRLLYVATTRAREALIVSRYLGKEESGTWSPLYKALDEIDAPAIGSNDDGFSESTRFGSSSDTMSSKKWIERLAFAEKQIEKISQPSFEAVSVTGVNEAVSEAFEIEYGSAAGSARGVSSGLSAGRGAGFGNAMHILLEYAVHNRLRVLEPKEEKTRAEMALKAGSDAGKQTTGKLVGAALHQLAVFRDSALWKDLLAADQVFTEVPFSLPTLAGKKKVILSGKIDLVFRKDGVWTIVDYKTDRTDAESLRETYINQVLAYSRAWESLADASVVQCGLWWTHEGRWIPLS